MGVGKLEGEVLSVAAEDRMVADQHLDIEITSWAATGARATFALEANALPVFDPCRDAYLDGTGAPVAAAAEGDRCRDSGDRLVEGQAQLRLLVAASAGHGAALPEGTASSATATAEHPAEEIAEVAHVTRIEGEAARPLRP